MTSRDIDPPRFGTTTEPPWELWLGHDLEQFFSFFTEIHYAAMGGLSPDVLDQLNTVRRWTVYQLRQLQLPDVLADAADEAFADLQQLTDPSVITDKVKWRKRRAVARTCEVLMQLTRAHVPSHHRRYYDFGVMLRQINALAVMIRTASELPPWVEEGWPGLPARYRTELRRACATLVSFVHDRGPTNAPDPAHQDLDAVFDTLAGHLGTWLAEQGEPDDRFLGHVQIAGHAAGIFGSARAALQSTQDRPPHRRGERL
ncbi:hypothetical protein [Streptomyces europaeiscabiei]|uniref:hypothetical protein n=1 Tax=Streptomyces europaeiscabiei TaxID=146819 RepID=UPI0029AB2493|nr:hypothetical protein [Streptomyces europaeiscabiei]MDX3841246.1 hypothetical protein [Streptomyces europaeiscabiei]